MSGDLSENMSGGQKRRGRPRLDKVSSDALRKRQAREAGKVEKMAEPMKATIPPPGEDNRLVAVTVYVPREDVRTIEFTADRLRKIARIPGAS